MIRLHGAGCSLIDNLYDGINFSSETFQRYVSRRDGDGGLVPGGLVFAADLAEFADRPYAELLRDITRREQPDVFNVGGPAIVPLVHVAQMLEAAEFEVSYSGLRGDDQDGARIAERLAPIALDTTAYSVAEGPTPTTDVLSDPSFDGGRGERTFINRIGVAGRPEVRTFSEAFFDADILFFGGTALVPPIHDSLTDLVRRGRESGALIVVTTVYDFRNEKRSPSEPWPLVDDYSAVDLVCTDHVEALRISGASDDDAALDWFIDRGVGAAIITRGPEPVLFRASRGRFRPTDRGALPVCAAVGREIERSERAHDTTGCGDNFVGGVLTSIMEQLSAGAASISLEDAVVEGNVAGGFAATYLGGLYTEARAGDKRGELERLRSAYLEQRA